MKTLMMIGALALSTPALADVRPSPENPDRLQTTIRHDDLNLARPHHAAVMLARIETAAKAVCGGAPAPNELMKSKLFRACMAETTDQAVAKLDAPLVTARHAGRNTAALAAN
jgi:UrcA family protein